MAATPTSTTVTLSMTLLVDSRSQRVLYAQAGKDVVDFLISLLASLVDRNECPSSIGNLYGSVKKLADAAAFADEKVIQAVAGGVPVGEAASSALYMVMDDLKVAPMSATSGGNGVALLKTLGVKCVATLQEKTVPLGHAEGLEILKASLQSKMVLTDVYLRKTKSPNKLRVFKFFFCILIVLMLIGVLGALVDEFSRPGQHFHGGCRSSQGQGNLGSQVEG